MILPQSKVRTNAVANQKLLAHELFHVISRANPRLRDKLYAIIGFKKCNETTLPGEWGRRKITNPDGPINDHFIELRAGDRGVLAIPVLLSRSETYDAKGGGEFFQYLQFRFLLVKETKPGHVELAFENNAPKLLDKKEASNFSEQIGQNTNYIIHPDEILADNFMLLTTDAEKVPSPQILEAMKKTFADR